MFDIETAHALWRYSHIAIGSIGLIAFWLPIFAKKGSRLHIRAGKVFVCCGYYVVFTALVSCVWGLSAPLSFLESLGMSAQRAVATAAELQFLYAILGFLAMSVLVGLRMGVRVIQTRKTPEKLATPALKLLHIVYGASGAGLLIFGLWQMPAHGVGSRYLICVILGTVGVFEFRESMRFLANPRPTRMAWWYMHMESMLGCGIGFHTAFLVFGFSRMIPANWMPGPLVLLPWLLPTAVGVPATSLWIRYYKRKFGELDEDDAKGVREVESRHIASTDQPANTPSSMNESQRSDIDFGSS